jgi:lysyl-tRNA synthetase class 2
MPLDEQFLDSLELGLPDCSGVALGFDRIIAAATDARSIADVVAFTHARVSP